MRIIAGRFKGHQISAMSGNNTRPTTDRAREAWGSTISSIRENGFVGARVLDLFAGSGALALEAISRGAASAWLVDNNERAITTIRKNLESLGLAQDKNIKVIKADALSPAIGRRLNTTFDCVFLDPPYNYSRKRIGEVLSTLIKAGLLAKDCLISYERRVDLADEKKLQASSADDWSGSLKMVSCKNYGISAIEYYLFSPDANEEK
jgi:16S rRNA (guanine966-N2)-methyltransferase